MPKQLSTKAFIRAELAIAQEGLAFYRSRVESLERLLGEDNVVARKGVGRTGQAKERAVKANAVKTQPVVSKGGDGKSRSARQGQLPKTGGDYWLNYVVQEPRSGVEIANAAIAALGFRPSKEQVNKLKKRVTPALNAMVESKAIKDKGAGRARRFFKK